jgi:hypothetical protein
MSLEIECVGADRRWELSPANPYVLSVIGALFSWPCFFLIANTRDWQPFGRFILLTYNLVQNPLRFETDLRVRFMRIH